jgi:hypothetical protein
VEKITCKRASWYLSPVPMMIKSSMMDWVGHECDKKWRQYVNEKNMTGGDNIGDTGKDGRATLNCV